MKDLNIPNAPKTPAVNFSALTGVFTISGISVPENSKDFYEPILIWLKEYVKSPVKETKIVFKLSYVNTSSLQFIYDLLMILNGVNGKGSEVSVDWYYMEEDIDMEEMGEDFRDATDIKFEFVCVDDV